MVEKKEIVFGTDIVPRRKWYRKPLSQVVPNKRAKHSKYACRGKFVINF